MMKMKMVAGLVSCALYIPYAQAGSLTVANSDLTLAGGMSGGVLYSDNTAMDTTGSNNNTDYAVTDFLVELSSSADKELSFVAGFGALMQPSVFDNKIPADKTSQANKDERINQTPMGLQYGWLTVKPSDAITIDAGKLATKIGYEVANTYANPHILIAGLWTSQPVYYPGVRATYSLGGDSSVFIEANEDTSAGAKEGYVIGGSTAIGGANLSLAYYDADNGRNILDLIVTGEIGGMPVAANIDFHKLDSAVTTTGQDDTATGIALYITPSFGSVSIPVRAEYYDDGTSGIYWGGMKTGYSFTVTPTYKFSDNTFVRAEVAAVTSDNKVFFDSKGKPTDSKTSAAIQAGYLF